jgi:hypothetical protein
MKESKIHAVDLVSGLPKWQKKRKSTISYCTPVIWDTPSGKHVVAAGHARMTGYDLTSGEEKWSAAGIPSGCCASPVTANGILYFAGWSPGGEDDPENAFPTFDSLLKDLDKVATKPYLAKKPRRRSKDSLTTRTRIKMAQLPVMSGT